MIFLTKHLYYISSLTAPMTEGFDFKMNEIIRVPWKTTHLDRVILCEMWRKRYKNAEFFTIGSFPFLTIQTGRKITPLNQIRIHKTKYHLRNQKTQRQKINLTLDARKNYKKKKGCKVF